MAVQPGIESRSVDRLEALHIVHDEDDIVDPDLVAVSLDVVELTDEIERGERGSRELE